MWRVSSNVSRRLPSLCNGKGHVVSSCMCTKAKEPSPAKEEVQQPKPRMVVQPPDLPPEPPVGRSGGGWFWKLMGVSLVGAGGVLGYAWYDAEFRKKMEDNVPYSKEAFDYIMPLLDSNKKSSPVSSPPSRPAGGVIVSDVEKVKEQSLLKKSPAKKVEDKLVVQVPVSASASSVTQKGSSTEKEAEKPAAPLTVKEIAARKKEEALKAAEEKKRLAKEKIDRALQEKEAEEAAENTAMESILASVLGEAEVTIKKAIETQKRAADTSREHSRQLKKAMDMAEDAQGKEEQWQAVTAVFQARQEAHEAAEDVSELARLHMEKLRLAIKDGKDNVMTKKNKILLDTQEVLNKYNSQLTAAERDFDKAQSEAKVMSEYRELVKKGRDQFKKELESITPEVKLGKRFGGKLSEEELNSLIAHAHRRIEQLQHQLAEYQSMEELHIQSAVDKQMKEDDRLAQGLVAAERDRLEAAHSVDKEKWDTQAQVRFEQELRTQLTRQAAAHSDHLAEVLKIQERELKGKFEVLLNERILAERDRFQTEVAGWIARLKGIETAVEGRAELEKIGRKAQELWLACQALSTSIALGQEEGGQAETSVKPLASDIKAIQEAGNSHPFVETVIASIPTEACQRGVWTQEALVERFDKVYRMGKRTSMIDETGGSMFRFLGSYMQALFVFRAAKPIKITDEVDPEGLNTFTLLDNARYALEANDLEQALRFMNQLGGEPRRVASDWIREARLLLETRQAADVLLAHASAHGLGSLF